MMASTCINECLIINDTIRIPTTYANLHKWPEAEAEFVRSISRGSIATAASHHPKAADIISCRQMYLRSYTFTRNEDGAETGEGDDDAADCENDQKCFGGRPKTKKTMATTATVKGSLRLALWSRKTTSHKALMSKMIRKLISCATSSNSKVDVDQ